MTAGFSYRGGAEAGDAVAAAGRGRPPLTVANLSEAWLGLS